MDLICRWNISDEIGKVTEAGRDRKSHAYIEMNKRIKSIEDEKKKLAHQRK